MSETNNNNNNDTATNETKKMRLRISNIPPMFGVSQVRKFIAESLSIPQEAIVCRKAPKWTYAFLSFRPWGSLNALPELEEYRDKVNGLQWKKVKLQAKLEEAREDPVLAAAKSTVRTDSGPPKSLNDQVTPLWKVPYEQQLIQKQQKLQTLLETKFDKTLWTMEAMRPSPIAEGYRNKCEFTIGCNKEGLPTVGFLLGGYREGIVAVANADETVHVPKVLKAIANHLQEFIRSSPLAVYNRTTKEGFWRLMLARVHDDQAMIVVQVSAPADELVVKELTKHMEKFKDEHDENPIKSLHIQETNAVHNGVDTKTPFKLLFGTETVTQTLAGLKFRISPHSFFQVNIPATEILYNVIKEYSLNSNNNNVTTEEKTAETLPGSVLLDLCCGTGTIGMILAKDFKKVIGVELVADAIADAKINAAENEINNITFECNRVEAIIEKVISTIPMDQSIVVVLDPPRNGVHPSVIKAVRKCERINRVVFVACNPEAAFGNFVDLTRQESKSLHGTPYSLKKAGSIDLFPHTEHCELVLQFDRMAKS